MATLEELGLPELAVEAAVAPKARRARRGPLLNGIEPADPASCYSNGFYFRSGGAVRATTFRWLNGRKARRGFNRRATCAQYPRWNQWVDLVQAVTAETGLSAAEAAYLLSQSGYQRGSQAISRSPEYRREYAERRKQAVRSPGAPKQQRRAVDQSVLATVQGAIDQGAQIAQARQAGFLRRSPRRSAPM